MDQPGERTWYDHAGQAFTAPADAKTCYDTTGAWRTHRLFAPDNPNMLQAITRCGRRAGAIPGGAEVDCPECLGTDTPLPSCQM